MAYGSALVDTIQSSTAGTPVVFKDGNGTEIGTLCRAWVCYQANIQTIRASFNVSSVTYSATGRFVINMGTALADTNYSLAACLSGTAGDSNIAYENSGTSRTTTTFGVVTLAAGAYANPGNVSVSVFR